MTRLSVGDTMPDFTYETPFQKDCTLSETVKAVEGRTALVFLRYYGCTLCQYDLHEFATHHEEIVGANGQMLVVLQSDPAYLQGQMTENALPYTIVCDPEQKLYQEFSILPAASMAKMGDLKTMKKIAKVQALGKYEHGKYEGNELQLPAVFVMDCDRTLTYAHYGKSAGDVPTPAELAELLK